MSTIVAVGSENKAKVASVIRALQVKSGVRDQPMSDLESIEGAQNRAKAALAAELDAQYGIGIEGGIDKLGDRYFQSGWCAVVDRNGKVGVGASARYQLSKKLVEPLLQGKELADVMDEVTGLHDVRSNQGAMGILTNGILPRAEAYHHAIIFAFAPFISDGKYWD